MRASLMGALLAIVAGSEGLADVASGRGPRVVSLGGTLPKMSKRQTRKAQKRANREAAEARATKEQP